jgi:cell division protein ZapA (FtsZ GTPase activity inhibitor)
MFYGFWMDNSRFLRNSEPLLTPRLASLAVQRPLIASAQLMKLVDELSSLLTEARSGKAVDKNAIDATAEQIRKLTKQIRSDQALAFVDRRTDVDLAKAGNYDQLGLDAVERLREVALDLDSQLKSLSEQSQTSTVSVDYLSRPSFDSLTKGIDKLTRVIQNSARRL